MPTTTITPPTGPAMPVVPNSRTPTQPRYYLHQSTFRRFTLDEYHRMIETGVLISGEPYELLEGNLVRKKSRGSPHDSAYQALLKRLLRMLRPGWDARGQCAITLTDGSEPEPDIAIVRGDENRYRQRHPGPADTGLVIEVADTSLLIDRHDKGSIYARANLPIYWVVNVMDRVIEVYSQPGGEGEAAAYTQRADFVVGSSVPVVLDGATVGAIAVADVMG